MVNNCSRCSKDVPQARIDEGYTICVDCSTEEKVSCHTIYPHKTGAIVQPVQEETKRNIQRLDRRSSNGTRKAKGIYADNSWDRWLAEYLKPKEDKPKFTPKPTPLPIYIPIREAMMEVLDKYEDRGYQAAYSLTQSLYTSDKISLTDKSKITNELTELESMTVKQRKFLKRL